ncbi:MAG: DUF559 domain-containing protein [Fimbriimonadaceae bacterium]|nr:DUF559 domain-containing protein [Fimbriimonadaceae bacterium]QYK59553.1 MAG: DUF559 domain-containing protein [Fimbriimonadaceae bacterium]
MDPEGPSKLPNGSLRLNRANVLRARKHRKEMGVSERVLWERLRNGATGFKFRRQHPVGPYLLDFYCPEAMLAVEVDGPSHTERLSKDESRDRYLSSLGVITVRVPSEDFFEETHTSASQWLETIVSACEERSGRKRWQKLLQKPDLSPEAGGPGITPPPRPLRGPGRG